MSSPVLAANLILNDVPELENEQNLLKSVILQIDDKKIGVIGYVTPDTRFLSVRNKVKYEDEVTAIRREVDVLKRQNVKIFVALGHSGYIRDLEIAKQVDGLDLVIGGHSNTFLWNSKTTVEKPEHPEGLYPTVVEQLSGRKVLVVQAYAYTKYMGRLHLLFNNLGEIIDYDGEPLLLDQRVPRDPELLAKVEKYSKTIGRINSEVVGQTLSLLDGICRLGECNLGNLIVDSIINFTKNHHPEYTNVDIAFVQSGRIRTSIGDPEKPTNITRGDMLAVMPFSDMLAIVLMNGTILKKALEHSVSTWRRTDSTGQFLQMAGVEVEYDLSRPAGSRVVDAKAVCLNCNHQLNAIQDSNIYKVIMPSFLADGGDGFDIFIDLDKEIVSYNEIDASIDYLKKKKRPVRVDLSGRITIHNSDKINKSASNNSNSSERKLLHTTLVGLAILFNFISKT